MFPKKKLSNLFKILGVLIPELKPNSLQTIVAEKAVSQPEFAPQTGRPLIKTLPSEQFLPPVKHILP